MVNIKPCGCNNKISRLCRSNISKNDGIKNKRQMENRSIGMLQAQGTNSPNWRLEGEDKPVPNMDWQKLLSCRMQTSATQNDENQEEKSYLFIEWQQIQQAFKFENKPEYMKLQTTMSQTVLTTKNGGRMNMVRKKHQIWRTQRCVSSTSGKGAFQVRAGPPQ